MCSYLQRALKDILLYRKIANSYRLCGIIDHIVYNILNIYLCYMTLC